MGYEARERLDRAMTELVMNDFFEALRKWKSENGGYLQHFGVRWDRTSSDGRIKFFENLIVLTRSDAERLAKKNFNDFTDEEQVFMARQEMSVTIATSI